MRAIINQILFILMISMMNRTFDFDSMDSMMGKNFHQNLFGDHQQVKPLTNETKEEPKPVTNETKEEPKPVTNETKEEPKPVTNETKEEPKPVPVVPKEDHHHYHHDHHDHHDKNENEYKEHFRGLMGDEGLRGPEGKEGPVGYQGPRGEEGNRGIEGKIGEDGDQGDQGFQGKTGQPGKPGEPGRDGPTGYPGPQGQKGIQGKVGKMGPRGYPGKNGKDAVPVPGPPGINGLDGKDFTCTCDTELAYFYNCMSTNLVDYSLKCYDSIVNAVRCFQSCLSDTPAIDSCEDEYQDCTDSCIDTNSICLNPPANNLPQLPQEIKLCKESCLIIKKECTMRSLCVADKTNYYNLAEEINDLGNELSDEIAYCNSVYPDPTYVPFDNSKSLSNTTPNLYLNISTTEDSDKDLISEISTNRNCYKFYYVGQNNYKVVTCSSNKLYFMDAKPISGTPTVVFRPVDRDSSFNFRTGTNLHFNRSLGESSSYNNLAIDFGTVTNYATLNTSPENLLIADCP
jgi:hypothetical protein